LISHGVTVQWLLRAPGQLFGGGDIDIFGSVAPLDVNVNNNNNNNSTNNNKNNDTLSSLSPEKPSSQNAASSSLSSSDAAPQPQTTTVHVFLTLVCVSLLSAGVDCHPTGGTKETGGGAHSVDTAAASSTTTN
jgi:hypothetical protein